MKKMLEGKTTLADAGVGEAPFMAAAYAIDRETLHAARFFQSQSERRNASSRLRS